MYKHILIPTDGSKRSAKAAKAGIDLAKTLGAQVTLLHSTASYRRVVDEGFVIPTQGALQKTFAQESKERSMRLMEPLVEMAGKAGVPCTPVHMTSDSASDAIVKTAGTRKCDLVVMGSHGWGGLKGLLLGSETTAVLTHCKVPVLVLR